MTNNNIACIYFEGNDSKVAVFKKENHKITLIKAESIDASLAFAEKQVGVGAGSAAKSNGNGNKDLYNYNVISDENSGFNRAFLQKLNEFFFGQEISKSKFIPILCEPAIYFQKIHDEKELAGLNVNNKGKIENTIGFISLSDNSKLAIYPSGKSNYLQTLDSLARMNNRRLLKIPSVKSAEVSLASYITRKYSAAFSSGLIDKKYSVYAKLGQILSSGYKNKTCVKFNSYFLSAIRYDDNFTTQFNFYGGPLEDGLGYTGVAKFAVKDKNLRRQNFSYWEASDNKYTYTLARRPEEIENFSQPHFELLNEWQINSNLNFNSALFLILGDGFFDYDGSWAIPDYGYNDYFRLKENGFLPDSAYGPTNTLIRAQVDNTQFGWIPRFSLTHNNGELFFGAELRKHRSIHWGSINYAENLPAGVTKEYKYYYYRGGKDIISAFVNETYNLNKQWNLLGEIQLAYHNYKLYDEKYVGTDFSVENIFVNPRLGINYKPFSPLNIYFSFARVSREPRLKEYYDAAESSRGEVPQFELNTAGTYNFDKPLVKPETMNDFEIGATFSENNYSVSLNLFYMIFYDEIVKNGQVDRFGQPTTGNVDRSIHIGAELSTIVRLLNNHIELFGNATFSRNTIEEGKFYLDEVNFVDLSGNRISGFPDFLANAGITFNDKNLFLKLSGKYVGKFFSDNYDDKLKSDLHMFSGFVDYTDNINDAYFVSDFYAAYEFNLLNSLTPWKIFVQVNNIFDNLYSAYAIGKEFFPAAERNWLAGIQVGL